ncbi:hypothetical protein F8568_016510 [Actinomadura sp. LD22]|uniref:DUF2335 domain-containing protein n=1 Tax=Actinomadura physcomitrii TaxID=2650748 RepID=A0A6I4MIA3_9ACTN|nr:hypothetical protein [Actinomadura physcomitrii]MWA01946.1 hypothetical protein [Actinomadura physcomitrii]
MSEPNPQAQGSTPPPETAAPPTAPTAALPPFPGADEAEKWLRLDPGHLAWRRELVERELRRQRRDEWIEFGFRLLNYLLVVAGLIAYVWLGKYAIDHHASSKAVPLVSGGGAGLVGAVLAVRNRRST